MSGSLLGTLAGTAFALVLVLGLAWGAIRLLKAVQDRQMAQPIEGASGPMKFLRAMPVGPRERVVLIEAEGERLLLGVAAGSVTLLARWPLMTVVS
jgi:flagellar protein FliO/FliZ